jgi:hypothetical protein
MDILLNALMPIFAVMGLGYFAGWIRDVDNRHLSELNALVMDFALPASLFVAMATTPSAVLLSQWPLFVTFLVSYLFLYAVSYAMQRSLFRLSSGDAAIQALTIAFPNNAAAGLPLIAAVFGPGNIVSVALSIAVGSIFLSPLTLGILEANEAAASGSKGAGAIVLAIGRSFPQAGRPWPHHWRHLLTLRNPASLPHRPLPSTYRPGCRGRRTFRDRRDSLRPKRPLHSQCHQRRDSQERSASSDWLRPADELGDRARRGVAACLAVGFLRRPVRSAIRQGFA